MRHETLEYFLNYLTLLSIQTIQKLCEQSRIMGFLKNLWQTEHFNFDSILLGYANRIYDYKIVCDWPRLVIF